MSPELEALIVRMAQENKCWGYDRIAGALGNLGHVVSHQTIGTILKRDGLAPAPKRSQSTSWRDFIAAHMAVLAGTDFFIVEVLTWRSLVTYYVLFFIHLETRRVTLAGITRHPTETWMTQMARNAVGDAGALGHCRYVLHDRGAKFCSAFDEVLASERVRSLRLPPRSPNLNAFAERWVRSVKYECLAKLILIGERSLHRALAEFIAHYHFEEIIRAKEASYSSLPQPRRRAVEQSIVAIVSEACFDTTAEAREYFDRTGSRKVVISALEFPMPVSRRQFLNACAAATAAAPAGVYAAGSDTIRIGMIGCGGRCTEAATQAMNADPGVRLVAMADILMDRIHEKRKQLKEKYSNQVVVDDDHCFAGFGAYRHVIESVDVVLIANAAKFHPLHMMAALRAGKHVFVEKPHAIDPAGIHVVRAACELARAKGLSLLSGLQSRYWPGYRETIARVHDGAIGNIVAIQETWLRAPYVLYRRPPGVREIEYQASNQYHFHWLSGDDVPQTLIHNFDRARWVMREQNPVRCYGMGGRATLRGEIYGSVFDHHSVVYEFADGVRLYASCRTIPNCYEENSSVVLGSKGRAFVTQGRIEGEVNWRYSGPRMHATPADNPYQIEHNEFFKAIRAGKPINSGSYMADSTMMGIIGQLSCYTGKEVTWARAGASDFAYSPRPEDVTAGTEPPVKPNAEGIYPVFIPGETTLL